MEQILKAAARFKEDVFEKNPLYAELVKGQNPEVAFITCSDSRVIPNTLTGTAPGQLFVLRNAGNLVGSRYFAPNGEAASLEYAVEVLKVRHIVICGHTRCGAVQYLIDHREPEDRYFWISSWLTHAQELHSRLAAFSQMSRQELLRTAVEQNVVLQLEHLLSSSFISKAVKSGELQLHGWLYELETGSVFIRESSGFRPLTNPKQNAL